MIIIAAGSSLPFSSNDSQEIVLSAFSALKTVGSLISISSLYESPAWPDHTDPPFINAAALIKTTLPPEGLLAVLHSIEAGFGRKRSIRNAPRTLDLDLIAYDQEIIDTPTLQVPHPGVETRDFVLQPICDLDPSWCHPITGKSAKAMLEALPKVQLRRI